MKKFLLLFFCFIAVQFSKAQSPTYDFSAVNDDGLTIYYKVIDEAKKEVSVADKDNMGHTYQTVTRMIIPDKVKKSDGTEYTVTDIGHTFTGGSSYTDLTELKLPSMLKTLMWQPFLRIPSIKKLVIPAALKEANGIIFQAIGIPCKWEEIYILGTTPPRNTFPMPSYPYPAFNMDLTGIKVYLPVDCSVNYKAREDWKKNAGGSHEDIPYLEQITLNANGYASLYLENENFEIPTGCTAYIVKGSKQSGGGYPDADIKAFAAGSIIPKQTAFILENLNEKGKTIGYHAHVSGTEEDVSGNLLVGSATETEFSGTGYKYYIFSNGALGQGFYHQGTRKGESIKVKAHRAGLKLPVTGHGFAPAKEFIFDFEAAKQKLTTGISIRPNNETAPKEDVIYDLQGRRVNHPTRGIYIVNGKKRVFN
jgi:hypothetical protein